MSTWGEPSSPGIRCPIASLNRDLEDPDTWPSDQDDRDWKFGCLGMGCGAWRWSESKDTPEGEGYCGLAGRPERPFVHEEPEASAKAGGAA